MVKQKTKNNKDLIGLISDLKRIDNLNTKKMLFLLNKYGFIHKNTFLNDLDTNDILELPNIDLSDLKTLLGE